MRHANKIKKLSRTSSHRKALFRNLSQALITHKKITTTLVKAKQLRRVIEPLITKAMKDDLHSKRQVMDYLKNKEAGKELFNVVVPKVGDRQGGYTRVIKLGNRLGDAAEMAIIELVDFNEINTIEATSKKEMKAEAKRKAEEKAQQEETAPENDAVEDAVVVEETEEKTDDTEQPDDTAAPKDEDTSADDKDEEKNEDSGDSEKKN